MPGMYNDEYTATGVHHTPACVMRLTFDLTAQDNTVVWAQ